MPIVQGNSFLPFKDPVGRNLRLLYPSKPCPSLTVNICLTVLMYYPTKSHQRRQLSAYSLLLLALLVDLQRVTSSSSFEPYQNNGGLVSAVAGKNFAIIATDTRMIGEGGYLLESRNLLSNRLWSVDDDNVMTKLESSLRSGGGSSAVLQDSFKLALTAVKSTTFPTTSCVMVGSAGCSTDCSQLKQVIRADVRAASYFGQLSYVDPNQVANLISQTLYSRRFFPYYAFCVVSGLDTTSSSVSGKVYVYDAIGSYEQVAVAASGTGKQLLQPILDRMFHPSQDDARYVDGSADAAIDCLCKAYRSVSEREIGVGDNLVLHVSEVVPGGEVTCRVLVVKLKDH